MLATRTAPGLDLFRPAVVRVHEMAPGIDDQVNYQPALSFPQHITAQQAIDALREMGADHDRVYYLFVTNHDEQLVGVVSLWQLLVSQPGTRLFELMDTRTITLPHDASLEEQAHLMSETGLLALPVVDDDGRLIGAIDTSDLIQAVKEESAERLYHLSCVCKREAIDRPLVSSIRDRLAWLAMSLIGALLAAWVILLFQATMTHMIVLAAFIPVMIGLSRSAGTQTLTLVVRSIALGKMHLTNAKTVLRRELVIGTLSGAGLGVLVGTASYLWQGSATLGVLVGGVLVANTLLAAAAGVVIPLVLKQVRINPAAGGGLLLPAFTGVCSLLLLLGSSTLALHLGYL